VQEGNKAVWSVAFNFAVHEHKTTFVAISANRVSPRPSGLLVARVCMFKLSEIIALD